MHADNQIATFLCFAGLLANGAALAQAQDNSKGAYVGFSAGQARSSFDSNPTLAGGLPINYSNSSGIWKAFVGYQFNPTVGAEVTYAKLGDYTVNVNVGGTNLYTQTRINSWGGALVGTLPLGKGFSLLGRVGANYVRQSRGDCNICASQPSWSSDNVWSPSLGVGAKYDFNPSVSVRAEAERFTKVGSNNSTFPGEVTLYTAGVAIKF